MTSPWLTPKEAADYVKRSESYIYQLISERTIKSYKPDGKVLLHVSDLDEYIQKHVREEILGEPVCRKSESKKQGWKTKKLAQA